MITLVGIHLLALVCYCCSLCSIHHNVSVSSYHCCLVIDVASIQFKLYVAFADTSFVFVYREVNAISCVENGAPILKRKSGEDFSILSFGGHDLCYKF